MSMTLLRRRHNPLETDLGRVRNELEWPFDRFLTEPFFFDDPKMFRATNWFPPIDVVETDNDFTIRAEAPGVLAKDLDITVSGRTLAITGRKEALEEKKGENYFLSERRFGSFQRSIDLPETADADKVTAESENGIITIHVAKMPGIKSKHIEVKTLGK